MTKNKAVLNLFCILSFAISGCSSKNQSKENAQANVQAGSSSQADLDKWATRSPMMVTQTAFSDHVCDLFASLDKSSDGYLEPSEYAKIPAWMGTLSTMTDKRVSIMEFQAAGMATFKKFAKQNPTFLTAAELQELEASK